MPKSQPRAAGMPTSEEVNHGPERLAGHVLEVLPAGPYTYFRLRIDPGDERWVVVADRAHRESDDLTVESHTRRRGFTSRRLDHTFTELHFGSIVTPPTKEPNR